MLRIHLGNMPEEIFDPATYFNNTYDDEWIQDEFAVKAIKRIDRSEVLGNGAIRSPYLGVISPEKLSGGVKALILMKNMPNMIFSASACGNNCSGLILDLAKKQDLTIVLYHLMDFGNRKLTAYVINSEKEVYSMEELMYEAFRYI